MTTNHGDAGRYPCPRCDTGLELTELVDHIEQHAEHLSTREPPGPADRGLWRQPGHGLTRNDNADLNHAIALYWQRRPRDSVLFTNDAARDAWTGQP
jgi:hypothetical protein